MTYQFASRMGKTPRSFIREILKVTEDPKIISFGGGLPNPALFPVEEIREAAGSVLSEDGTTALQYSTTEGYLPLREFIAERYRKRAGLKVSPHNILITNGSQQCLDLIGKVFIDRDDPVAIERPGYLGAIQAFSLYEPCFHPVPVFFRWSGPRCSPSRDRDVFPQAFLRCAEFPEPLGYILLGREAPRGCPDPFRNQHPVYRGRCIRGTQVQGR